jgi:hypothetical protein
MSKQIEENVDTILAAQGVTFERLYVGENQKDGWTSDAWIVTFKRRRAQQEKFEFFTGLGHRKLPAWSYRVHGYDGGPKPFPGSQLYEKWLKQGKPVPPRAASVLYSLVRDNEAASISFREWCSELGYDVDSRKAFAIYEACQQAHDKLVKVFTQAELAELREALQDY